MGKLGTAARRAPAIAGGGIIAAGMGASVAAGMFSRPPEGFDEDRIAGMLWSFTGAQAIGGAILGGALGMIGGRYLSRGSVGWTMAGGALGGIGGYLAGGGSQYSMYAKQLPHPSQPGQQFMSGRTQESLSEISALRSQIARLHRPIQGMGY